MGDYIDRDAVKQMINRWADGYSYIEVPTEWAEDEVRKLPTVDAVEVVRCSDCEYWDRNNEARLDRGCYFCSCFGGYTRPTFYCAVGERKGGAEDAVD